MKQLNDYALAYGISVQCAFPGITRKRHSPTLVSSLSHNQLQDREPQCETAHQPQQMQHSSQRKLQNLMKTSPSGRETSKQQLRGVVACLQELGSHCRRGSCTLLTTASTSTSVRRDTKAIHSRRQWETCICCTPATSPSKRSLQEDGGIQQREAEGTRR